MKYRSITSIIGYQLPKASKNLSPDILIEEWYQIIYIMIEIEHKSIPIISELLHMPETRVAFIMQTLPYKLMVLAGWQPFNLCDPPLRQSMQSIDNDNASINEIRTAINNYEIELSKMLDKDKFEE